MTKTSPELSLELVPRDRVDVIDVTERIHEQHGNILADYPKALFCSYHTTAGYFDQALCARLRNEPETLRAYLKPFRTLFPPDADYRHDQMDLRTELTADQRVVEPRNGDSHLTFIGSGLENCVSYRDVADTPVYFVDLDGFNDHTHTHRRRRTTVIGYGEEEVVEELTLQVPVSAHGIDAVNLRDARVGIMAQLQQQVKAMGIDKGWIQVSLDPTERHAGLTVNEYETLLMRHDLADVLRNPVRFMAEKGRNMLRDPRAIPGKAKNYAKYDLVRVMNEVLDALGLSESVVERILDRFVAMPASRFLRMRRSVRLLVNDTSDGAGPIVHGRYQSPILVQWKRSGERQRTLRVRFVRLR